MQKLITTIAICFVAVVIDISAQRDYCFRNNRRKIQQTASFTVTKNKVEGTFDSGGFDKDKAAETFDFTGTKTGNRLTIKFQGRVPYNVPPGTHAIVWTLRGKSLEIPMYEKNLTTHRGYTVYIDRFSGPCSDI
ncbi:MAG: hypothetical protein ABI999_07350 [Acidobacteriota bacterium]